MIDIVFWIATIVAIALGILLIGIEFYEDWSLNSQVTEDASDAPPMVRLRRLAFRTEDDVVWLRRVR